MGCVRNVKLAEAFLNFRKHALICFANRYFYQKLCAELFRGTLLFSETLFDLSNSFILRWSTMSGLLLIAASYQHVIREAGEMAKSLILYDGKMSTTERVATAIGHIVGNVRICEIAEAPSDISMYDGFCFIFNS